GARRIWLPICRCNLRVCDSRVLPRQQSGAILLAANRGGPAGNSNCWSIARRYDAVGANSGHSCATVVEVRCRTYSADTSTGKVCALENWRCSQSATGKGWRGTRDSTSKAADRAATKVAATSNPATAAMRSRPRYGANCRGRNDSYQVNYAFCFRVSRFEGRFNRRRFVDPGCCSGLESNFV